MLIKLNISKHLEIECIPVVKHDKEIRLAKKELLDAFYSSSKNILSPSFLKQA